MSYSDDRPREALRLRPVTVRARGWIPRRRPTLADLVVDALSADAQPRPPRPRPGLRVAGIAALVAGVLVSEWASIALAHLAGLT